MAQLAEWVPVREAARRLGVSAEQVRGLVAAGQLAAVRPGREWLVRADSLAHRVQVVRPQAGRPWSARIAWAVLSVASGLRPEWVSSAELVRVRRYARRPVAAWPRLLANRARVCPVRMLPAVAARVRALPEVSIGGAAAAVAHGANLVSSADDTGELYLSANAFQRVRDFPGIRWDAEESNTIFHVLPELPVSAVNLILADSAVFMAAAVADLLDQGDERLTLVANELLRGVTLSEATRLRGDRWRDGLPARCGEPSISAAGDQ